MSGPGDIDPEVSGDEAAWRDIVAHYDAPADPLTGETPWPAREDLQGAGPPDLPSPDGPLPDLPLPGLPPSDRAPGPASEAEDEDDERYVPVPLPPPRHDAITRAAWAAVICGPAYLLIGTFLQWNIPGVAAFAAVAAFIGGFVALVVKLGDRPRDDDDDDGAVL